MTVQYKNQTPIYPSSFLDDISEPQERYKVTFLGNYKTQGGTPTDLYFVHYADGNINAVHQFGEDPSEYGSGEGVMYSHLAEGRESPWTEVYKRAVQEEFLKEKVLFVGYSHSYSKELEDAFEATDYAKNYPSGDFVYGDEAMDLPEEEHDKLVAKYEVQCKTYDEQYLKKHGGELPQCSFGKSYHIFKDLDEARKHCLPGIGTFKRVTIVNDKHLDGIVREENFYQQVYKERWQIEKDKENSSGDLTP